MAKTLNITGDRSVGDAEPVTEFAEGDTLTTAVQHLDELLMSLHTAQHQTVVARGGWSNHFNDTKSLSKYDKRVSWLVGSVAPMNADTIAHDFFDTYSHALVARPRRTRR